MGYSNLSAWSLFAPTYTTETDWADHYSLSSDGEVLTISSDVSGTRFMAYYSIYASGGDVLEFDVEAAGISGDQVVLIQIGTLSNPGDDTSGSNARSMSAITPDNGSGLLPYHLKMVVPETTQRTTVAFVVGARSSDIGVAQFMQPRMYINGRQIGFPALPGPLIEKMGGTVSNYATFVLSNGIDYSNAQAATNFRADPFMQDVGGINDSFKVVGTLRENSSIGLIRYGSGDTGPGVDIYRTSADGPGITGTGFNDEDEIGHFTALYHDGTETKIAGRIRFFYKVDGNTGTVFSLLTPPTTSSSTDANGLLIWKNGDTSPRQDGTADCGTVAHRWHNIRATNGSIQTSDARVKDNVETISEPLMRAWGRVGFKVFQLIDAIKLKGMENARLHVGVIAQEVKTAFEAEGLDAAKYGLFCHDEWDAYDDGETKHSAGDLYGIRYEEALALECAYQRWRVAQLEARVAALENNNQ